MRVIRERRTKPGVCRFKRNVRNWQHASAELAICTARVEGRQMGPRALLHALHCYALRVKIILADLIWQFQPRPPNRQI